jgi:F-type H+-transporting ATPase subunit b
MWIFIINNIFIAAGGSTSWFNVPGYEIWRFVNLFLFVGALIFILRRPIGESMRARRENIKKSLRRAQEERDAALAKLSDVEARLSRLDEELVSIRENAKKEAEEERMRIAQATEEEARKLREQARLEIEMAGKVAKRELQRYAAEESVKLAESIIKKDIKTDDDVRLWGKYVDELGGVRR